jgi:hypothetical protein
MILTKKWKLSGKEMNQKMIKEELRSIGDRNRHAPFRETKACSSPTKERLWGTNIADDW